MKVLTQIQKIFKFKQASKQATIMLEIGKGVGAVIY